MKDGTIRVAAKIVEIPFVLNTSEVVSQVNIIIGDTSDWEILPVGLDDRVCNSFGGCLVPTYEFLFTSLGMHYHALILRWM